MRYSTAHKDQTRAKILAAAARVFRQGGFGGAGIDGLTRAAGVTNGAFYGHFKTKAEAFRAAVESGLNEVREGIAGFRREHGAAWVRPFVAYYLGPRQAAPLGEACALPTLSAEVMRADEATRSAYSAGLRSVVEQLADGLPGDPAAREDAAIALLALLAGGAMLGRAVSDPALAARIHEVVARHAVASVERS